MKLRGRAGGEVEVEGAIAAVFQKLDAGKGRTKEDMKRPPQPGIGQRVAQAADGMTEKTNLRHA